MTNTTDRSNWVSEWDLKPTHYTDGNTTICKPALGGRLLKQSKRLDDVTCKRCRQRVLAQAKKVTA